MTNYADLLGPRRAPPGVRHAGATPQRVPLKGRENDMVRNAAGGVVFKVDDETALRRFLILGTSQGTYYAKGDKLSNDALQLIDRMIEADPFTFVDIVVSVSVSGSPLKQSPCLFAIARACSVMTGDRKLDSDNKHPVTRGRAYALAEAPRVLRTYQHAFEFLDYVRRQRGAGPGLLRMLRSLALRRVDEVEYQTLKYRNRVGWKPRDLLRFSHPKTEAESQLDNLFAWTTKPESEKGRAAVAGSPRLAAFEELQAPDISSIEAAQLIAEHRLTHEMVPNTLLGHASVWGSLLKDMPLNALVRNLRKMTQVGLLMNGTAGVKLLREKLVSNENLRRARVHPLRLMMADRQYRSGTSTYGHGSDFTPSSQVLGILEEALELSWANVEPLNKRILVAIDDSGSMGQASGAAELTAFEAGLALMQLYARTENDCTLVSFTERNTTKQINVSNRVTWNELVKSIKREARGTDLAEPMNWANRKNLDFDVIIMITDNETWSGRNHGVEALTALRKRVKHNVALIPVSVTPAHYSIGDNADPHTLNVVGFDPNVPLAIAAHVQEVFS